MSRVISPLRTSRAEYLGDAPVIGGCAFGDAFCASTGDGGLALFDPSGARRVVAHQGVSLALVAHPRAGALSGGDDGKLVHVQADGARSDALNYGKRWINALASSPASGLIAVAVGKSVDVYTESFVRVATFEHPSTVSGLAFDAKGKRLAAAHNGGASVWMAASATSVRRALDWKGSHLGVQFSPCGRFLVTTLQEPSVHGWRLEDRGDFKMEGYPSRVKSVIFVDRGRQMATNGAGADILLWPFIGKSGPAGKTPGVIDGIGDSDVEILAAREDRAQFAAGFADGSVRFLDLPSGTENRLLEPSGAPVAALVWSGDGRRLMVGRRDGAVNVLSVHDQTADE